MLRPLPVTRLRGLTDAERGLNSAEASARRAQYGNNQIIEVPSSRWRAVLRETARDPMIWFLIATALLYAFVGEYIESVVLILAIAPVAGMDAYLHRRTRASTASLSGLLASRARAVRDGAVIEIPASDLVPGDLVLVAPGDPFPADGLIVASEGLQVDESALTGEALPVRKRIFAGVIPDDGEFAIDAVHWGVAGTRVLTGTAKLRLAYTGAETLYSEIVRSALEGARARTPLQTAVSSLVTVLLGAAIVMCGVIAWVRFQQGFGLADSLLSAVTLAVAALPEEFPVVFTFFLGVGVYRLARRAALVRRGVAVENVGRITCICSDKTGTLTAGRLRLAHRLPAEAVEPEWLLALAGAAARRESRDPLDDALLDATPQRDWLRLATFPFTEDRRRETAIFREAKGSILAATKGAPETILDLCALDPAYRSEWLRRVEEFAQSGHKVIAVAWCVLEVWPGGEPDHGFHFAGLLACEDPVREGVKEAVAVARAAGIRVLMVTGDHPATAAAIAAEMGLGGGTPKVMEGAALPEALRRSESRALPGIDVVARALPAQKLEIVRALQSAGEIVAVTGDGVNDVPALQAADVGIAMGERGTRSAREVAAIVLLDDNFRTIVGAIAEGRVLFRNLQSSFAYLLMIHIPLVLTAALIPLAGLPLLYLPVHIVWLELIIHPTALLVFQTVAARAVGEPLPPRPPARFFSWRHWLLIGIVSAAITAAVALGYERSLGLAHDVEHARAMALVTLVVAGAVVAAGLSRLRSTAAVLIVFATVASAVLFVQVPQVARLLHVKPLHADDWLIAIGAAAAAAVLAAAFPGRIERVRAQAPWTRRRG